ncbi:MAG: endonuclease III [Sulfolobaceae archaeon]|nr:endonuclease III [Sulfolobaceae archaeon]
MTCNAEEIKERLSNAYKLNPSDFIAYQVCLETHDPFKVLIATVLSQNTSDKLAGKAFKELEKRIGVTPQNLAKSKIEEIREAIKSAGLYNSKSIKIKRIAEELCQKYECDINKLINGLKPEEARNLLLDFEGIGEKTADVVLLTCYNMPYLPVDTHIKRVSKRLGLVNERATYNEISTKLKQMFKPNDYLLMHHLLIHHGRVTCKAKKPLCQNCVLSYCCEYYSRISGSRIVKTS